MDQKVLAFEKAKGKTKTASTRRKLNLNERMRSRQKSIMTQLMDQKVRTFQQMQSRAHEASLVTSLTSILQQMKSEMTLRPEKAAEKYTPIDKEWMRMARNYLGCMTGHEVQTKECNDDQESFLNSCAKVVFAVIDGSSGDKRVVTEYMDEVCHRKELTSYYKNRCSNLTALVLAGMTDSNFENRQNPQMRQICTNVWDETLKEEQLNQARQAALMAEKAKEKEAQEEAHRKQAELNRQEAAKKMLEKKKAQAEAAAATAAAGAKKTTAVETLKTNARMLKLDTQHKPVNQHNQSHKQQAAHLVQNVTRNVSHQTRAVVHSLQNTTAHNTTSVEIDAVARINQMKADHEAKKSAKKSVVKSVTELGR